MNLRRNRIIRLLNYYFEMIASKSGLTWDYDNKAEIAEIIELIFEEVEEMKNNINNMIFDLSINMNTADNDKLIFTLRNEKDAIL